MHTAMILAAGRGERLKPLTEMIPKALCRVHNVPLIEYHIENLVKTGIQRIVINHAYLGSKIRHYLGHGSCWGVEIVYSPEPPGGLETGGGIVNALSLLGNNPFIVVNADVYCDYSFSSLTLSQGRMAHVVLVPKPESYDQADFGLSGINNVENKNRQYTFAGIACYSTKAFKAYRVGRYPLAPILRGLAEKQQVSGEVHHGIWCDVGTPARLLELNATHLPL